MQQAAFCSCLNLPGLPSHPISSNPSPPKLALPSNGTKWRRQCVLGVACVIVALQTGNMNNSAAAAAAEDAMLPPSQSKVIRWSDKRACPPWHVNSLENIVPENLPRPSAHRRWENVRYRQAAPAVKGSSRLNPTINSSSNHNHNHNNNNACFTL